MALSNSDGINLSMLAYKVTGILRPDSTFVDLIKMIVILAIALEKEYNERFLATLTVNIAKSVIGSALLTAISV